MSILDRYSINRNLKISTKLKEKWADPLFREFMKTRQISKAGSFLVREKNSNSIKKLWKTKEYREKQLEARKNSDQTISDTTKSKISLKLKGRPSPRKGYVFTEEERKRAKMNAEKVWKRPEYRKHFSDLLSGKNNPNWKEGASFLPYSPEFNKKLKEKIKQRDSFKCRYCEKNEGQEKNEDIFHRGLSIHHKDFNKNNNTEENLITSCRRCNMILNFKQLEEIKL